MVFLLLGVNIVPKSQFANLFLAFKDDEKVELAHKTTHALTHGILGSLASWLGFLDWLSWPRVISDCMMVLLPVQPFQTDGK